MFFRSSIGNFWLAMIPNRTVNFIIDDTLQLRVEVVVLQHIFNEMKDLSFKLNIK